MINNLNILLPEIFLTLSIFSILMIGVYIKKSFNLIFNLTSLIIILTIAIIVNSPNNEEKIFLESFTRDSFSNFFKVLILISSLFVLNSSKNFILDNKLDKIESKTMIGYSNLSNLLSRIKFFDEFKTNKLERSIKTLKKFENESLIKLSKNIFSSLFGLLIIIAIVNIIINEVKLNIKLKLFFI